MFSFSTRIRITISAREVALLLYLLHLWAFF